MFLAVMGVGASACGAETEAKPAPPTPSGTLKGATFTVGGTSGFSLTYPPNTDKNPSATALTKVALAFTTKAQGVDYCGHVITRKPAQTQVLVQVAIAGETVTPGTFAIGDAGADALAGGLEASAAHLDATCESTSDKEAEDATAGTLTIEHVDDGSVSGTVDLTFPSGSMKGAFTTPLCARTTTELSQTSSACHD